MMQAEHRDLIEQMARLLEEVDVRAGADFSGVGIIVADSFDSLPLINLRPTNSLLEDAETATALARISHHRSEEHTSELQSLMRISYAVSCLKTNNKSYTPLTYH